jgi:hypothetical protein
MYLISAVQRAGMTMTQAEKDNYYFYITFQKVMVKSNKL